MNLTKLLVLGLASSLFISACHAGSSERRKSLLTEKIRQETSMITEPEDVRGNESETKTETETPAQATTEESGTGVNNGILPIGPILSCHGEDERAEAVSFTIDDTALITDKKGVLTIGDEKISLTCLKAETDSDEKPGFDQSKALWNCSEVREGEGLYHVIVQIQGFTGRTLGTVTIGQESPLEPAHVLTMSCSK